MKRKLFTKTVAIISLIAALVSTMSVGSYASTQVADDTDYLFFEYFEDSLENCLENEVSISHVGQTFKKGYLYGWLNTHQVTPANSPVYLNVRFFVAYRESATQSAYATREYGYTYLGIPDIAKWYRAEIDEYSFDTERVVRQVNAAVKLSETPASQKNGVGTTYKSLVTNQDYQVYISKSLQQIFDHGYDYLEQ